MTAPRVPLQVRGRRAAPAGPSLATAMFDALNKASDEKELRETARIADERAQAELARRRSMEDTRLRLDIDKAGYRITDPTAERGQDDIVVGPSPIGGGVLTRTDPLLKQKRKNTAAFTRLQARDPEKWREPVEDFDYDAAEVQELAIDELSTQLNASGMFKAMNPAQLRAIAANTMNKNPEVRGLMERAVKAQMPEAMTEYQRNQIALQNRKLDLDAQELSRPPERRMRDLSAGDIDRLSDLESLETDALAIADVVARGKRGTGWVNASLPNAVANWVDSEGRELRSVVSALESKYLKLISGAAVTESEAARLKPFVPSQWDQPDDVEYKALQFARVQRENVERRKKNYRKYGFYVPDEDMFADIPPDEGQQ